MKYFSMLKTSSDGWIILLYNKTKSPKNQTRFKSFGYRAKCHQFSKNKGEKSHDKIEYKIFPNIYPILIHKV